MGSEEAEYGDNGVIVGEREKAVDERQEHLSRQDDVEVLLEHSDSHDVACLADVNATSVQLRLKI